MIGDLEWVVGVGRRGVLCVMPWKGLFCWSVGVGRRGAFRRMDCLRSFGCVAVGV